jgi:hypothetical protein
MSIQEIHFVPEGDEPTLIAIWRPIIYTFIILLFFSIGTKIPFVLIILLPVYVVSISEYSPHITISLEKKTLHYAYFTGLGKKRQRILYLQTVKGTYRIAKVGKWRYDWKLFLKNTIPPYDSVTLEANAPKGFTKNQLDEVSELIDRCKA